MKFKVILGVICVVAIAGGVCYIITKSKRNITREKDTSSTKSSDVLAGNENDFVSTEMAEDRSFNDIKANTVEIIQDRHEEAGKIMKESVERIFESSDVNRETKNDEAKKKMLDELSNM